MRQTIGWRECVDLPELKLFGLKAKVDTGAKTSSLHVAAVTPSGASDKPWLELSLVVEQNANATIRRAQSVGKRRVKSSTGHVEERHVIVTMLRLAGEEFPIEVTLSDRADMTFPMLIGRSALRGRFLVDCAKSYRRSSSRKLSRR